MISTNTIDSVRSANIVDVVSNFIDLKKKGSNYGACCPFHDEKTPSFNVNSARGRYKCFGCGVSGDAIKFVMEHKRVTFAEAVEIVAGITGITMQYDDVNVEEVKQQRADAEEQYKLIDWAWKKYVEQLRKNEEAKQYWLQRRFTEEDMVEWGIGFSPAGGKFLYDYIREFGKDSVGVAAGLLRQKEGHTYDAFQNRLMIPIEDVNGRVVGFGGRTMDPEQKQFKYLNTAETALYRKGKMLFALNRAAAAIRKTGLVNIVEGYMDVIRLHQCEVLNTVAASGTAFTADQAKLLKKFGAASVRIVGDGDKAGVKMMNSTIDVLLAEGLNPYVCIMPEGEDPDSYFNPENVKYLEDEQKDGVVWKCQNMANNLRDGDISVAAEIRQQVAEFLLLIKNMVKREAYYSSCAKMLDMKPSEFKKLVERIQKQAEETTVLSEEEKEGLPDWMDPNFVNLHGFGQNEEPRKGYPLGIYFKSESSGVFRVTNFTIRPLYHLVDATNNRRLIEVHNGRKTSVIEMPSRALVSQDAFEVAMIERGSFTTQPQFGKFQFKRLSAWISDNMKAAYELKTLGWQPEGFWAFSDRCFHNGELKEYNEMGVVDINDESFISLGISNVQKDFRQENNLYENDLYLKYSKSAVNFQQWAEQFCKVYPENGPMGVAFALYTIFKDIVVHVTKIPHLYCYGPKGSGKSDFAESLTWLFFSGKNADGKLIQGFNLNPGQSTYFSFFSRLERFRNCPILFNEFDEDVIEDYKFGAIKSAYDGEGREVGDGESGKRRKTMIQKVQGTLILVGQYMSVKDDGSVLSRSLTCPFKLERVKQLTDEDVKNHRKLKDWEENGLSSVIVELLQFRPHVQNLLKDQFLSEYKKMTAGARAQGVNAETRILKNYSLCTAMVNVFSRLVALPFKYEEFYDRCLDVVVSHNRMLKDNSALNGFWKTIEFLFDQGVLKNGTYFDLRNMTHVTITREREEVDKAVSGYTLMVRWSALYALYAKAYRERTGKKAPDEETLLTYLKDQPYFIGLVKMHQFDDKRTSCYALTYSGIGVNLEKVFTSNPSLSGNQEADDMPF